MEKKRQISKRILTAIAAFMLVPAATLSGCIPETEPPHNLISSGNSAEGFDDCYDISSVSGGRTRMVNKVDGYELTLPGDAVIDTAYTSIRTGVEYGGVKLYIYAEDVSKVGSDVYIGYSNSFVKNGWGTTVKDSGSMDVAGCTAQYNTWVRKPLSKVENDRNNYACFDIITGEDTVHTLMFKYDDSASYEKDILPVVNSFKPVEPTLQIGGITVGQGQGPAMNAETAQVYENFFGDQSPLTWGVYLPYLPETDKVRAFEEKIDYDFDIYLIYTGFNTTEEGRPSHYGQDLAELLEYSCPPGKVCELTLQTSPIDDQDNLMVYDVLNGVYDKFLHDYAAMVANYGQPMIFRLCNEMNGDWCSYSGFLSCRDTDIFIEFYRYIFDIFQQEGADNAIWVFNPNHKSFPDFKWNHELMYYPGDEYVNVVGLTAYNTGTYYEDSEVWSTFDELYHDLYTDYAGRYAQPLMITEFASSSVGGDKVKWVNDMFDELPNFPHIKAAVWWSGFDLDMDDPDTVARPYMMDENDEVTAAFRERLAEYKR